MIYNQILDLSACLENVANAATSISNAKGKQASDGQLFEIKHLLILREQIAPFQTEFKVVTILMIYLDDRLCFR